MIIGNSLIYITKYQSISMYIIINHFGLNHSEFNNSQHL